MIQNSNIYLIGLMGAGKTTVGRQLAKRLQKRFADSDHEIEERTGVRIPVIFEIEGEDGFRKRENQVLAELSQEGDWVIATGGGAVLLEGNRQILRNSGTVIYLHAPPEILHERTHRDRNRPLLQVLDPLAKLRELYAVRDPIYREVAHLIVDSKNGATSQLVKRVENELKTLCKP